MTATDPPTSSLCVACSNPPWYDGKRWEKGNGEGKGFEGSERWRRNKDIRKKKDEYMGTRMNVKIIILTK